MITKEKKYYSSEEYLKLERAAEIKSEYFNGEIFAMSGASVNHNIIAGNIFANLHAKLKNNKCKPFTSDMRINVSDNGLFTYPDISVICGEIKFLDDETDTVTNPKVIFEVLSRSTQNYDRGGKFKLYRDINSLEEYILVSQDTVTIEHFIRQKDNKWLLNELKSINDSLIMNSINCTLELSVIYEDVKFL